MVLEDVQIHREGSFDSTLRTEPESEMDKLLLVPDLETIGHIHSQDMEEMLHVNEELLDFNVTKEDMDNLLNIESFYPSDTKTNILPETF